MKTLFYGGKILTMDENTCTDAVLTENGKIIGVGSRESLQKNAGECLAIDLSGKTMMPAFMDPHSHFFQVAAAFLQVSLDRADSCREIGIRIGKFIEERNFLPGQWVNARDYDNNIMPDLRNPSIEDLDSFAPNNPLVIHHKSGHMGLMNTAALNALGITPDIQAPEGGKIEIIDGKLTGYLEENAFFDSLKKMPMADPLQLLHAFQDAQKKYASYGITTVQDGMVADPMLPMYELLLQKNLLYLDVVLYSGVETYESTKEMLKKYPENRNLHSGGIKMFLDGSPQGRTAWMRTGYKGDENYHGYGTMTDDAVEDAFQYAAKENTQIIAHCNGDAASEQFLRCLEKMERDYPNLRNLRPVIIHGQLLGLDQLPLVKKLGVMVSFFAAHVYHWGDVHIRNFGLERASQISPAASALREGVKFTFHQDAPVIEPNMLETVWCAVNRVTKDGAVLGANEAVSVLDALKAVTVNAAYQYGQEEYRGTITAGKSADFVILDGNPLETPKPDIRNIQVLATIHNGSFIYQK